MLIQKRTQTKEHPGKFIKTNLILSILTYLLVLYSTFLTRSGVLGDASVHSFVSPGMMTYFLLLLFIGTFTILGFGAIIYRWRYLEKTFTVEENILSRELALFTASVTLIASSVIILAGTSAPIFGSAVEISFYNEMNLPIAILMGLLNGVSLMLNWKKTKEKTLVDGLKIPFISTFVITIATVLLGGFTDIMAILFLFSAYFTLVTNTLVASKILRGNASFVGGYVAHIGFALFMLGVIASGWFTKEMQVELIKGETKYALGYELTFTGYHSIEHGKKFAFDVEINDNGSKFSVAPIMYIADFNQSLMRDPDILNFMTKDFYVSPVSFEEAKTITEGNSKTVTLTKGASVKFNDCKILFAKFNFSDNAMNLMQSGADFFIGAVLEVTKNGKTYNVEPKMKISSGGKKFENVSIDDINLKIVMTNLDASGKIDIVISEISDDTQITKGESLWVDVSVKPFMNLIWIGTLIIVLGFFISMVRRTKEAK
jgi:cytochrome c-type biogenesis protein CcmF